MSTNLDLLTRIAEADYTILPQLVSHSNQVAPDLKSRDTYGSNLNMPTRIAEAGYTVEPQPVSHENQVAPDSKPRDTYELKLGSADENC
jgi:hypothetical protein